MAYFVKEVFLLTMQLYLLLFDGQRIFGIKGTWWAILDLNQ